jgi:hypothetical protein
MKFLGEEIKIEEAAEPTDIIWENREYSPNMRLARTIFAWLVIIIMLGGSFIFIFFLSVTGNHAKDMFPSDSNCT